MPSLRRNLSRLPHYFAALTLLLCVSNAALAAPQGGPAQPASEKEYSEAVVRRSSSIARQTMSPFCPGRTLADCPSEYATAWRRDIREMVDQGLSADEIQKELESRVGGNLSGIPNREASYAVPIAMSLSAALVLYLVFARLRRKDDDETPEKKPAKDKKKSAPPQAVDDERLAEELAAED